MDKICILILLICCWIPSLVTVITGPGEGVQTEQKTQTVGNTTTTITVYSCKTGYVEAEAGTCSKCTNNKYGVNCSSMCTCDTANTASCDHVSGACTCKPGYEGSTCASKCSPWKYGLKCAQSCTCVQGQTSDCNHISGACSCKDGYIGTKCDTKCSPWTFGAGCSKNCTCNQNFATSCRNTDGVCDCKPGYKGTNCQDKCATGTFGDACASTCPCSPPGGDGTCHHVTGICFCTPGWLGNRCVQKCPAMKYGQGCTQNCTCVVENTKTCSHTEGSCQCKAGYTGDRCNQVCPDRTHGDLCASRCECPANAFDVCNPETGQCICKPGWTGKDCNQACAPGTYGSFCHGRCIECDDCDIVTGDCSSRNSGLIAGIIVLSVLLAVLAVVFIFYVIRVQRGADPVLFFKSKNPKLASRKKSTRSTGEPSSPPLYYNTEDRPYENTASNGKLKLKVGKNPIPQQSDYENFTGPAVIEKDAPSEDKYESVRGNTPLSPEHTYELFNKGEDGDQHRYSALRAGKM